MSGAEVLLMFKAKNEAKGIIKDVTSDLQGMGSTGRKAADDLTAGQKHLADETTKAAEQVKASASGWSDWGNAAQGAGKLAIAGVAAISAAVVGVTAVTLKMGADASKNFAIVANKSGLSGAALERLETSFRHVAATSSATGDVVATVMGLLSTKTGMTGTALEGLTKQVVTLSKVTGTDAAQNVTNITRMFGDWSVSTKDQSARLDELYKASQISGVGVDRLSQLVVQFGAPLRTMGFSFQESTAMLAKFEKEGVNTELVMGSLRIAAGNLAKEQKATGETGKSLGQSFREQIKAIQNTKDSTTQLDMAFKLFGRRAGADMLDSIKNNKFAIDDYVKALESSKGAISASGQGALGLGGAFTKMKNSVEEAVAPVTDLIFDLATQMAGGAASAAGDLSSSIGDKLASVVKAIRPPLEAMVGLVGPALNDAAAQTGPLIDSVVASIRDLFGITTTTTKPVDELQSGFKNLGGAAGDGTKTAADLSKIVAEVKVKFTEAKAAIEPLVKGLVSLGTWIAGHQQLIKTLAIGFGALAVVGTVVAPIVSIIALFSQLAGVIGVLSTATLAIGGILVGPLLIAMGAVVLVILGLKLAFETNFLGIKDIVTKAGKVLTEKMADFKKWMDGVGDAFKKFKWGEIGTRLVDGIWAGIKAGWDIMTGRWKKESQAAIDAIKGVFGIKSPSRVFFAIGQALTEGFLLGLMDRQPELREAIADLFSLEANAPDWRAKWQRFFGDTLSMVDEWTRGLDAGAAKEGSVLWLMTHGPSINFANVDNGGGKQNDRIAADMAAATKDQREALNQTLLDMKAQQDILNSTTATEKQRAVALEELQRLYGRVTDQEKELEDVQHAAYMQEIERLKAKGQSLGTLAWLEEQENGRHDKANHLLDEQGKRQKKIGEDEAAYLAREEAARQRIKDLIEASQKQEEDGEASVFDQVMAMIDERDRAQAFAHEQEMGRIDARAKAEDDANTKALAALDEREAKVKAGTDADAKRLDAMNWRARQMQHDYQPTLDAESSIVAALDAQIAGAQSAVKETLDLFKSLTSYDRRDSKSKRDAARAEANTVTKLDSAAQKSVIQAALDSGKLTDPRQRRVAQMLVQGRAMLSSEVNAMLAGLGLTGDGASTAAADDPAVKALQAQRAQHQGIIDARQKEIDKLKAEIAEEDFQNTARARAAQVQLDAIDAQRKAEETRHKSAAAAIQAERTAEDDKYRAEQTAIEALKDREQKRHDARMKQIQQEYALLLMEQGGMTDAQIQAVLDAQLRRAADLAKQAADDFAAVLAAAGLVPVSSGGGSRGGGGSGVNGMRASGLHGGGGGAAGGLTASGVAIAVAGLMALLSGGGASGAASGPLGGLMEGAGPSVAKAAKARASGMWRFGDGWGDNTPGPGGGPYGRHGIGQGRFGRVHDGGAGGSGGLMEGAGPALTIVIENKVDDQVVSTVTKTTRHQQTNKRWRRQVPGAI